MNDLGEHLGNLRVMVAPLRFGAGAKGKVASSLAHGAPCVGTSIAAEGMGLVDGKTILIADAPDDFADQIVSVYADEQRWAQLSLAGWTLMSQEYSFAAGERRMRAILTAMGAPVPAQPVGSS